MRRSPWLPLWIPLCLLAGLRLWPHAPLRQLAPESAGIWSADGELLRVTLAADGQYRLWMPLEEISPSLVDAFLLKEDQWFYWHPGVNPISLVRGGLRTWRGQGRQGGSTLTMQLARLAYRINTRTPGGKAKQVAVALWLEARYSKRNLLEAYLNLAPFGANVEGVGVASLVYFGKPASRIALGEAITLAVIPQRPASRAGRTVQPGHETNLLAARARLASLIRAQRSVNSSDLRQLDLPLSAGTRFPLPWKAPHFVDALLTGHSRAGRVNTTLDAGLQRVVERQIDRYLQQFGERGIRNAAALVLDSASMEIRAWVGSADYWNLPIHGQVNGVLAKRSPGSTLKPFVYGLALDQGILHPKTILKDAPTSFGAFTPENFDGRFFGPLTAEDALIRSRNIPAVWTSMQLRQPNLYQFLRTAGISGLRPESYYGLALTLGGGEINMEELAGLYAMLANQGLLKPLRAEPVPAREGVRLLSPEAAFITVDMLSHNPRPGDDGFLPLRSRWPVAWKTGTSWGFRDAWSVGLAGPYVVLVWIGDFEGEGNPGFIGMDAAAPLFFRIVDALNLAKPDAPIPARTPPRGVSRVAVCAQSGDLPNPACPSTVDTWYIPGKSPFRVSDLHRVVAIDTTTGQAGCPGATTNAATNPTAKTEVVEFWPSDMMKLFRETGMPRRIPPSLPDCGPETTADTPTILSPLSGATYTLRGRPGETIALEASVAAGVRSLYWFDGNALLGGTEPGKGPLPWVPDTEGLHPLRLIDDHGRTARRDVEIHFAK